MEASILPIASICEFIGGIEEPSESEDLIVLPFAFIVASIAIKHLTLSLLDSFNDFSEVSSPILSVIDLPQFSRFLIILAERQVNDIGPERRPFNKFIIRLLFHLKYDRIEPAILHT